MNRVRVHVVEGGEYECTHMSVHMVGECIPEYHAPYVEVLMDADMLKAIQSMDETWSAFQSALSNIYDSTKAKHYRIPRGDDDGPIKNQRTV